MEQKGFRYPVGLSTPLASIVQNMVRRAKNDMGAISREIHTFELFSLFLQLNRRLVGLLHYFQSPLSTIESHCLAELSLESDLIARELTARVSSEKSTISRTLSALKKRQLIVEVSSKKDLRSKFVRITNKGKLFLEKDVTARNSEVLRCTYMMSASRREELTELLSEVADILGARSLHAAQNMEPLLIAIRRAGKVMGIIGGTVFDTGFTTAYMQVLWLAFQENGVIRLKDLVFTLPYPPSEISHLLSRLEEQSLIIRRQDHHDKRRSIVELTPNGLSVSAKLIDVTKDFFLKIHQGLGVQRAARLQELMIESVIGPLPAELVEGKAGWEVQTVSEQTMRQAARAFLIEQYVIENLHRQSGSEFLKEENTIRLLTDRGKFLALLEYKLFDDGSIEFVNYCNITPHPARVIFCELAWDAIRDLPYEAKISLRPVVSEQLDLPNDLSVGQASEALTR